MNNLHSNSLVWLIIVGGAAGLLWLITTVAAFQVVLGLLLVLVLPGYALMTALFTPQQLGWAERILLSCGASMALGIVGSLALHQSGVQLQAPYWIGLSIVVTVGAALSIWLMRRPQDLVAEAPLQVRLNSSHLVLLGLAVLVTSVAFTTTRSAATAAVYQGYTILWLTPQEGTTPQRLQLGVTSKELTATTYTVQIKVDDQLAQEWPQLQLAPHQNWQANLEMPVEQMTQSTVEVLLYRLDQPETPYRRVVLRPQP